MAEPDKNNGQSRAAVLLLALGQERAAEILRHMGPKEVHMIGTTMAELASVSDDIVDSVLQEFVSAIRNPMALAANSDEYVRDMLTGAFGAEKAGKIIDRVMVGRNGKSVDLLKRMNSRAIADMLREEHPQIIAIVLSLLEGDQAAEILTHLPAEMRADLLMRIATMDEVHPVALKELDGIIENQLTTNANVKLSSVGGMEIAANILNYMESGLEEVVIKEISDNDAELGQKIQDKMFVFENLLEVDDRSIQTLLREISTDSLLLALRGADERVKDKILRNMSKRASEILLDDLAASPPAKLSQVEQAQKDILAVARRLADAGDIALGGSGGDQFV